ncbi:hypothetical protein OS493_014681 [Desmophyllum pertusum]|uniref:Uncharacterized protein n=1 Tax=Desmophyllum pertusum TaxID=174260 RepID=A0A9X0CGP5_9CNID|nr:hypothetical protein OS493_014681 [Desmophyllum pertusum]
MNSYPFLLFLSFLLFQGSQNIGGVEQKRADYDNLVVTDGLELQKVLEQSARGNVPTTATTLSDEEGKDLQSAPATGLEDSSSDTGEDGSRKNIVEDSADSGGQVLEDKKNSNDVESKELSKNKRRLTPVNDRGSKNRHDIIRTNRNYELKERLNIDSEGNKDQRHATRDSVAKIGENKLVRTAEEGKTAEFESSNAGNTVRSRFELVSFYTASTLHLESKKHASQSPSWTTFIFYL